MTEILDELAPERSMTKRCRKLSNRCSLPRPDINISDVIVRTCLGGLQSSLLVLEPCNQGFSTEVLFWKLEDTDGDARVAGR